MDRPGSQGRKLRMTRQRRVLLDALRQAEGHPTADEVYRAVRRRLPRISLGTVYRNLEVLSQHGLVRKIELGTAPRRFDAEATSHYHVRCLGCGRVADVDMRPQTALERDAGLATDYEITGHRVEFLGLCRRCLTRGKGPREDGGLARPNQGGA